MTEDARPPWTCANCEQVNAAWATECGRCGTPAIGLEDYRDVTLDKAQTLFYQANTKACVDNAGRPAVAIIAEGGIYVYVISPRKAMVLALGLIEAANNAVTNTMLFQSLTAGGMSEADAGRMVTAYTIERSRQLREDR